MHLILKIWFKSLNDEKAFLPSEQNQLKHGLATASRAKMPVSAKILEALYIYIYITYYYVSVCVTLAPVSVGNEVLEVKTAV